MTSIFESSRKSSAYIIPAQIVARITGIIATVLLARNLSVEDYGVYNLFLGSALVFSFLTNIGIAGSLQRFLPEYARLRKNTLFFKTFFYAIGYRLVSAAVVFVAVLQFFDEFAGFFNVSGYKEPFILFCIGTYALFQIEYIVVALNAMFLHQYTAIGQIVYTTLRVVLIAIALLKLQDRLPKIYFAEFIAYGIGGLLLGYFFWIRAYEPMKEKSSDESEKIEWRRFLRFSAYNASTIPGGILFSNAMDYFVVAVMATTNQLGIYALGSRASKMLLSAMPQSILQTIIRPALYHRYYSVAEKDIELNRMHNSLVVMNAAFLFPIIALVGIHAESILVLVFRSKFADSTPVFLVLLFFNIFTVLELPSDLVLQTVEKVQARLYAQVFAIYNLIAAVILMPKYGVLGVAFATGSALMGKCLFYYIMARYYTGISICWAAIFRIAVNTVIAAIAAYWVDSFGDSYIWIFTSLSVGLIIYIALFFANNFLSDQEKELVNRLCQRHII